MNFNLTIRKAQHSDLKAVFQLVKDLAAYEKLPNEVWIDITHYEDAFADNQIQILVAEVDQEIIGMALFYLTFSTWKGKMMYLEDFVVTEPYRQYGIGQKLFDAFLETSKAQNCKLVKWQVIDWNIPALKFYEKNGAIIEKEWWNGKIIF